MNSWRDEVTLLNVDMFKFSEWEAVTWSYNRIKDININTAYDLFCENVSQNVHSSGCDLGGLVLGLFIDLYYTK